VIEKTIKSIREEKNFSQKYVADGILTSSQLSKIENGDQKLTVGHFIKILHRLCITFDEFCLFTEDEHILARTESKHYIAEILQNANLPRLKEGIKRMDNYHKKFNDIYFYHMSCVLMASHTLYETNNDYEKAREVLTPISDYLNSVEAWFYYELTLFANVLFLYSSVDAVVVGKNALKRINEDYERFKDYDIARSLLINLAIYSLDANQPMLAFEFSNKVLAFPQSTNYLYDILLAKIINQIACFKLRNNEYDNNYLTNLVNTLKLLKLDDMYREIHDFMIKHNIDLAIVSKQYAN